MVKEVFTFNHDVENVNEALGLSDEQDDACREAIFFSTISNYLIGLELFDEPNDVPKSLKTMTGDLEKSLGLVTTEKEKSYLLFIFKNMHDLCIESIAKYKFLKDSEGKDKMKMEILLRIMEMKIQDAAEKTKTDRYITPAEMFEKIEAVKKSRYNYEKYLSLIQSNKRNDEDNDIEGLIKDLFRDE